MTVEELIEELKKYPKDIQVRYGLYDEYSLDSVELVDVENCPKRVLLT